MKLPNAHLAVVSEAKLVDYLLSPTHRRGKSKAAFFLKHGFAREKWEALAEALQKHALLHEVKTREENLFGTRYVIDGAMHSPDGQDLQVRAAWFIDKGGETPRFITAHPLKRKQP